MENYFGYTKQSTDRVSDRYLTVNNFGYTKNIDKTLVTLREKGRSDYQIIYIHKGKGEFLIKRSMVKLEAGSLVVIYPGEKNHYVFSGDSAADYYWIHFTGTGAEDILKQLKLSNGAYHTGEFFSFIEAMDKMAQASAVKDFTTDAFLAGALLKLLSMASKKIYIKDSPIHRVIEHMQKNSYEKLSVTDYANMCGLTEYYFIRKFKKITGMTPHRYKTKITINKAIGLMAASKLNISEIAYMLGFEDSLYFSRVFKKEVGISPKSYINKYFSDK